MTRATNNMLPELQWYEKRVQRGVQSSANVSMTITTGGRHSANDTKRLAFSFRDKIWQVFDSKYITFAVMKNRIFFKGVEAKKGYAITSKSTSGYMQATIYPDEISQFEPFIGDYSLKYDEYYELYYIEREGE